MLPRKGEHRCSDNAAHLHTPEVRARSAATRAQVAIPVYYEDIGCIVVGPRCQACPQPKCIPHGGYLPEWQGIEARDEYIESHPRYRRFIGTVGSGVG